MSREIDPSALVRVVEEIERKKDPTKRIGLAVDPGPTVIQHYFNQAWNEDEDNFDFGEAFKNVLAPSSKKQPPKGWRGFIDFFKRNANVAACVRKRTSAMLGTGWDIVPAEGIKKPSQKEYDAAVEFFDNCSPYDSFDQTLCEIVESLELGSYCYTEIVYQDNNLDIPVQLLTLPQETMQYKANKKGMFDPDDAFVQMIGTDYRKWKHFAWKEILWSKYDGMRPPNSLNPYSPIDMLRLPVETEIECGVYMYSFFASGGKVGFVFENPKWTQSQAEEWCQYIEREYIATGRAHRVLALYDGTTMKEPPKGYNQWVQFLDVMKFSQREICGVFEVDPRLIGAPSEGNLGGKGEREQAEIELQKSANRRKVRLSSIITKQILQQGLGIYDWQWRLRPYKTQLDAQSFYHMSMGMKTLEEGAWINPKKLNDINSVRLLMDSDFEPLEQEDLDKWEPFTPTVIRPVAEHNVGTEVDPNQRATAIRHKTIVASRRAQRNSEKRANVDAIGARLSGWTDATTGELADPIKESVRKASAQLLDVYRSGKIGGLAKVKFLPGIGELPVQYKKKLKSFFRSSMDMAHDELSRIAKGVGLKIKRSVDDSLDDGGPGDIDDYLEQFGVTAFDALYADIVTRERRTFLEGIKAGWNGKEFVSRLLERVDDVVDNDLATIVRTSTTDVFNIARKTIGTASGIVAGYEYSAILDDVTTEVCSTLDGLQLAADDPRLDQTTPPNHYNCRSVEVFITTEDELDTDDSQAERGIALIQSGFGG